MKESIRAAITGAKWRPGMPYMDVRVFISEKLRSDTKPSAALDRQVCRFLKVKRRACTSDLAAAISLIPEGWWWHISHLEAVVIPTTPCGPISNGAGYDVYGRPLRYMAMCWDREQLPMAVCEAMLKAAYDLPVAFVVERSERGRAALEAEMFWDRNKPPHRRRARAET